MESRRVTIRAVLTWALVAGAAASVWREDDVGTARQTGVGPSGTEPASQSPWSPYYWFGESSVNEAMSVLFPAIGSDPLVCKTSEDDIYKTGLCMRLADCPYYGGEGYGSCGGGLGTCCVFSQSCTGTTNMMVSHFVSKTFTTTSPGVGECKLTVNPRHNNICQYRLDFDSFNIAQPDPSSDCTEDFFGVTGGSHAPKLCGDLTGQHIYINAEPGGGPIILTMDTSKTLDMKRDWNIKVTQIDCNSPYRAPAGCLQFFNETSGMVKSMNFKGIDPPDDEDMRQIQNLNYGVCINAKVGYCDLTWTQSKAHGAYSFTMSGDGSVPASELKSEFGVENCVTDYVSINGGVFVDEASDAPIHAVRYCGTKFPEVKTKAQPYVLHVTTDVDEGNDRRNLGFAINFRQNLC
ncbi:uncharacterized protein LOC108672786 isoform X3 [Hyalella azteca]|uniref:Uncharacterized protein LOC108672786 isoform X3 n=1 Tax=Hyalella azteca TaxID=294128 RepID=A0A8B7NQK0_HYAAZ|nr:uncharacterized protein LOC108672786 isoform X3 [Hyalella azteca]